jgi:hypothetical protein
MHTQANPIPLFIIRLKYHGIFPTFSQFCRGKKGANLSCEYFSEQLHQPGTDPANHQWVSINPYKDKQKTTRANPTNEKVSNLKSQ